MESQTAMEGKLPEPQITITVRNSIHPFMHVEEEVRGRFADHEYPQKEDLLPEEKQEEFKEFGPHPMLPWQMSKTPPWRWIHIRFQVEGTNEWVRLFVQDDNLYVRGFQNQHGAYEIGQLMKKKQVKKKQGKKKQGKKKKGKKAEAQDEESQEETKAGKKAEAHDEESQEETKAGKKAEAHDEESQEETKAGKKAEAHDEESQEETKAGKKAEAHDEESQEETESLKSESDARKRLPSEYNCILLEGWDVKYSMLLGLHFLNLTHNDKKDKIEQFFQEITKDPEFAVRAIKVLSSYRHKSQNTDAKDANEKKVNADSSDVKSGDKDKADVKDGHEKKANADSSDVKSGDKDKADVKDGHEKKVNSDSSDVKSSDKDKAGAQGKVDKEEAEAMKMLAGIIFLFCEHMRMKLRNNNLTGRFVDYTHVWGDVCLELLRWREGGFKEWITDKVGPDGEVTKACERLRNLGITSPIKGLILVYLILNISEKKSKQKPTNTDPDDNRNRGKDDDMGKGGKGNERGKKWDNTEDNKSYESESSFAPGGNGGGSGPLGGGSVGSSGIARSFGSTRLTVGSGLGGFPGCEAVDCFGKRRLQLLGVFANFSIEWLVFYDWHRPQVIYSRRLIDGQEKRESKELALVGPTRPIGAYGILGVKFCTTSKLEDADKDGVIDKAWMSDYSSEDEPTCHQRTFVFENNKRLSVRYMLIPNAIEASVEVRVLLKDTYGGYNVSGVIEACGEGMKNARVKLFCDQTFEVPSAQWTKVPLMVSLICVRNADHPYLGVSLFLELKSRSNSGRKKIEILKFNLGFNELIRKRVFRRHGHTIEVTVGMST